MLEHSTPRVLVTYSKNFKQNMFFKNKIEDLTKNLERFDIVSIDDSNKFTENFFKDKVAEKYTSKSFKNGDLRKVLETIDYAILFWDGSDFVDLVYLLMKEKKNAKVIPVETTRVVNRDKGDKFDVYIGRSTPWGNPYVIGDNGSTREEVIKKYKDYFYNTILKDEQKRKDLLSLKGKVLGCHCKPLPCHGDIISEYLNTLDEEPTF